MQPFWICIYVISYISKVLRVIAERSERWKLFTLLLSKYNLKRKSNYLKIQQKKSIYVNKVLNLWKLKILLFEIIKFSLLLEISMFKPWFLWHVRLRHGQYIIVKNKTLALLCINKFSCKKLNELIKLFRPSTVNQYILRLRYKKLYWWCH